MSTTPTITFARRPHDWEAAGHLHDHYLQWLRDHITTPVPDRVWLDLDLERVTLETAFGPPHHLALAWIGPVPVGILGARASGTRAELTRFFVSPLARGSGVAFMLIACMMDRLAARGIADVDLVTAPGDMPAAAKLYERFGFETTDAPTECVAHVHMTRRLAAPDRTVAEVG
jgi:ribosomal protein S18 acetylase RimI-like enzyme